MSPPLPPLDQLAEQIVLLSRELTVTGRLLFSGLDKPMQALKSGRAPRALGMAALVDELSALRQSQAEILQDLQTAAAQLSGHRPAAGNAEAAAALQSAMEECRFWRTFDDRVQILLKKLTLIADLEKLSPLGRAPLQDAWDEVQALALAGTAPQSGG